MAWNWGTKETKAAQLLAEDDLTDPAICAKVGISERTLNNWKIRDEFKAAVSEIREALRKAVLETGIADRVRRVERLNDDWQRLQTIRDRRAAHYLAKIALYETLATQMRENGSDAAQIGRVLGPAPYPGAETGLIVRTIKVAGREKIEEFGVDTALLSERRALEMQAAKELGQWIEKKETNVNVRDLSAAESLDRKLAALAGADGADSVSEGSDSG